jgi:hypothetical protein
LTKKIELETRKIVQAMGPPPTAIDLVRFFSSCPEGWASGRPQQAYVNIHGKEPTTISEIYVAAKIYFHDHLDINVRRRVTDDWNHEKLAIADMHERLCKSSSDFTPGNTLSGHERLE